MRSAVLLLALPWLFSGCAIHDSSSPTAVADRIRERTGVAIPLDAPQHPEVPKGVTLDDGLTAEEAVATALWNNADFRVSLSDLGFARADLLEAGLLTNPVLSLLFPVGPKQIEATLKWPIEALWERPKRVAAARVAADAAAERLVFAGLDLVARVKLAYADAVLAQDRLRLLQDASTTAGRIEQLAQSRFDAGDIAEIDARAARADAARAAQEAARAARDIEVMRERLRGLLGFAVEGPAFALALPGPQSQCGDMSALLREASVSRPDVRAAELAVEAAGARLGWERSRIMTLTAVLDANGSGETFQMGPGIEAGLPIFSRNQGGRARAEAEMQRASAAYVAAQQRVAGEIREAVMLHEQAQDSRAAWDSAIIAPLEQNVATAERAFDAGDTPYLFVLEHARRLNDARLRRRELDADLERAHARIERAIGRSCGIQPRS